MIDICEQLQIPAKSFLYLGDTATDMKTSMSAGCFSVGVLWGFRPEKELRENGAQAIINAPLELIDLLN
jgi:phosphoglycolate phosphatase